MSTKAMQPLLVICAAAIAIHAPSLILFAIEPSYSSSIDGLLGFFAFSVYDYLRYLLNQSDPLAVLCVAVMYVLVFSQRSFTSRTLLFVLVLYVPIASVLFAIRCLGGFGGLWV